MGREIKFMAWCTIGCYELMPISVTHPEGGSWRSQKILCVVSQINTNRKSIRVNYHSPSMGNTSDNLKIDDDIKLLQYTGLKDIWNKEIYDGFVVKGNEIGYDMFSKVERTGVVMIKNGNTYYSLNGRDPHQLLMYLDKPEIIGNIYENPELLNSPHGH